MKNEVDSSLDRIFDKLESIEARVIEVEKHLAVYNVELERHIEGVEIARCEIKVLTDHLDARTLEFSQRLSPVEEHVKDVKKGYAIVKWLVGAIFTLVVTYLQFFKK